MRCILYNPILPFSLSEKFDDNNNEAPCEINTSSNTAQVDQEDFKIDCQKNR